MTAISPDISPYAPADLPELQDIRRRAFAPFRARVGKACSRYDPINRCRAKRSRRCRGARRRYSSKQFKSRSRTQPTRTVDSSAFGV